MEVLKRLVKALAWEETTGLVNYQAAAELTLSGIDMDMPFEIPVNIEDEMESQSEAPEGSEIWVLTDFLAEGKHRRFAEVTAKNIVERRMVYSYFIPFSSGEGFNWRRAIQRIENHVGGLDPSFDPNKSVAVYQLSDCAFSARLRITNPRSDVPTARYSLGTSKSTHLMFTPAPTELVLNTVAWLTELLSRVEEEEHTSAPKLEPINGKALGHPKLGFIRRVFPAHT